MQDVSFNVDVGVDSTSSNSAQIISGTLSIDASQRIPLMARYQGYPGIGRHVLVWLERSDANGTTTWMGTAGTTFIKSGIQGEVRG
jgi:hypothetical protein